jgi:hypothetical protein
MMDDLERGANSGTGAPIAVSGDTLADTIDGRVLSSSGRPLPSGIEVWFAYRTAAGDAATVETATDERDRFLFDVPPEALQSAMIGSMFDGIRPVDLEPMGEPLTAGSVVLFVDDLVQPFLRFGCFG